LGRSGDAASAVRSSTDGDAAGATRTSGSAFVQGRQCRAF
jgi:hypothetical protein